jgi:peptidoglycan hydrolase-like protein with peptidoglycan-binding domain
MSAADPAPVIGIVRRRAPAVAAVIAVVAAVIGLAVADPFASGTSRASLDNAAPTATRLIRRGDLSSQTDVSGALGYADSSTISVPSGTTLALLQQAQQPADSAAAAVAQDERALVQARAARGAAALQSVTAATEKLHADERLLASASDALAQARSSASAFGDNAVYTMLPAAGHVVTRGRALYAVEDRPVLLLYGATPTWRAFVPSMTAGHDVAELNANLRALGYGDPSGDAFTSETEAAIARLQTAHGLPVTGRLLLGSVVFERGAVRITGVTPTVGANVQPGPVLMVTSLRRVVTIALDAAQQASVHVGDPVMITLPDNSATPGRVSYVGRVASAPSGDGSSGAGSPTIELQVTADRRGATGRLDQAPVDVSITTASVHHVLVVPVNALLALTGGGYAVEEVEPGGLHRLVAVSLGLFDDADGLVQVRGSGIAAGQRVVVPAS